ncbi:MAG: hypothetical protein AAFX58_10645 [Pseudomonadota bacterium]
MNRTRYAQHIITTLDTVRAALGKDVSVLRLEILFHVYVNDGCTQSELRERMPLVSATAMSRNLAELSALTPRKQPGLGLLRCEADTMNLRSKLVTLTAKGRRLVERLLSRNRD